MKRALITGVTGQDGSYLAEFLLAKGYQVCGLIRRGSSINTARIDQIYQDPHETPLRFTLAYADLGESSSLSRHIDAFQPDEVYNLAAQSHVRVSFEIPEYTGEIAGLGALRMLEAIKRSNPAIRFYQASSSEMFGKVSELPLRESSPFYPRSPYAAAKVYAYWITVNYREAYGMYACNGILFNHESPRRGETFVTRKITRAVARIKLGVQRALYLGNMEAQRDWGYAPDYVEAMWMMLQQREPDDYVVATGEMHTVREFVERAFSYAGLDWREYVKIDPRYYRPTEVDVLLGDAAKARKQLGWSPQTSFQKLIEIMVDADLASERRRIEGEGAARHGFAAVRGRSGRSHLAPILFTQAMRRKKSRDDLGSAGLTARATALDEQYCRLARAWLGKIRLIPFFDNKLQYASLETELVAAARSVLASGQYILGPETTAFEAEFAAYCGVRHAVGVSSGTSALHLALRCRRRRRRGRSHYHAVHICRHVAAIRYTGARPVFVDIDPETLNIDAGGVERAVTARTKAILPVHLYGQPADMDPILEVARRRGIWR